MKASRISINNGVVPRYLKSLVQYARIELFHFFNQIGADISNGFNYFHVTGKVGLFPSFFIDI